MSRKDIGEELLARMFTAAAMGGEKERMALMELFILKTQSLPEVMQEWLEEYAMQGNIRARELYCTLAVSGGVEQCDWIRVEQWLLKLAETKPQNAYMLLGTLYTPSAFGYSDAKQAAEYFRQGGESGAGACWASLALLYREHFAEEHSLAEIRELMERGFALGGVVPLSYETLADVCHELGDEEASMRYLLKYHKFVPDDARNCLILGYNYKFGKGCRADAVMALKYYQKAANLGDGEGLFQVGLAYYEGCGVRRNYKRALDYFKRATEAGNPRGYFYLGMAYIEGNGAGKNEQKGVAALEIGAAQDDIQCCMALVSCYIEGIGVEKDAERVKALIEQARSTQAYAAEPMIQQTIDTLEARFLAEVGEAD